MYRDFTFLSAKSSSESPTSSFPNVEIPTFSPVLSSSESLSSSCGIELNQPQVSSDSTNQPGNDCQTPHPAPEMQSDSTNPSRNHYHTPPPASQMASDSTNQQHPRNDCHTSPEWYGMKVVADNIDKNVKLRYMRTDKRNTLHANVCSP